MTRPDPTPSGYSTACAIALLILIAAMVAAALSQRPSIYG